MLSRTKVFGTSSFQPQRWALKIFMFFYHFVELNTKLWLGKSSIKSENVRKLPYIDSPIYSNETPKGKLSFDAV
jgi:hypothetical protein